MNYKKMSTLALTDNVRHTDQLFIKKGKLYKIFTDFYSFEDEKERNITFLLKNRISNTPNIIKKLRYHGRFIGYIMEFIPNTVTFRQAINSDIDYEKRTKAVKDVYAALKELHNNNLFLGDVHSDNFLISKDGDGYIIDLEEMRGEGDEFKFKTLYLVKPNKDSYRINICSQYTDNVKLMISSLSLLYDIDLERYIDEREHSINLESLYNEVICKFNDERLDEYFQRLINKQDVDYFADFYFKQELIKKR